MKRNEENYLEKIPVRKPDLGWRIEENGEVTLLVENKGFMNRVFQKFFKKPKVTQIHLDEIGSFVWPLIDGEKNIVLLGQDVEKRFGEKAQPTYERLAQFFRILESYRFVSWKD